MDIKNLGEFANYCQEQADDETLPEVIDMASRWVDYADALRRQYGGHGETQEFWIDMAFDRGVRDSPEFKVNEERLRKAEEFLELFSEKGEAFSNWLHSKVIVVKA